MSTLLRISWLLARLPRRAAVKTLGDVLQVPLENVTQAHDQGFLLDTKLPESG